MASTLPLADPCGTWPTNRAPSRAAWPGRADRVPDEVEFVLDREVPVLVGQLHQRAVAQRRGVVVQDVDAAETVDRGVHPGPRAFGAAQVHRRHGRHYPAGLGDQGDGLLARGLIQVAAVD